MAAETILAVLQHALGVDERGRGEQYRNHFVCGEGHHSYAGCCAAVDEGLMVRREHKMLGDNGSLFQVTGDGKAYVEVNSPPPPKLSRGQRRYRAWLNVSDVTGETFFDFLKRQGLPA